MISFYLELSTCHITPNTAKKLDSMVESGEPIIVYDKEGYGWFIPVLNEYFDEKEDMSADVKADIPEDLKTVFLFAKENGCRWIIFDADAEKYDNLPNFSDEWERR